MTVKIGKIETDQNNVCGRKNLLTYYSLTIARPMPRGRACNCSDKDSYCHKGIEITYVRVAKESKGGDAKISYIYYQYIIQIGEYNIMS